MIRARLIACDSLEVYMFNCEKSNKHLTNALKVKEEQYSILSGENKYLYVQNDNLKQAIDKEKRKKNWIAGALGTGIGAAVIITVVSFLRK